MWNYWWIAFGQTPHAVVDEFNCWEMDPWCWFVRLDCTALAILACSRRTGTGIHADEDSSWLPLSTRQHSPESSVASAIHPIHPIQPKTRGKRPWWRRELRWSIEKGDFSARHWARVCVATEKLHKGWDEFPFVYIHLLSILKGIGEPVQPLQMNDYNE